MGKPIKDRGITWKETYGEKSEWLKAEFDQQVGIGSYFRWEGHDYTTGNDYYVVISPGFSKKKGYHFFAGLRKMPAEDGASGKKFLHFREAMSYAQETWGVPPPQEKPAKEYAVSDIAGKPVFEDIAHKRTATAAKVVMMVVPDDFLFEKDAMAAQSMPPDDTNWDRPSTYGPKIMKRLALLGQALSTVKAGNRVFVPYLRMKALDACAIKKASSVAMGDGVPESLKQYAETRSYKYSNPTPPNENLWNAVVSRGTVRRGSLFEMEAGQIKEVIPPIFDQSMNQTADFDKYKLTKMRDVPNITYTFKWPSVRDSFSLEEKQALRQVGIQVTTDFEPTEKTRIAYSIQTVHVPRLGTDSTWGVIQFESFLKKSPGAPTLPVATQSPRPAFGDKDIPRVSDMVQRNARAIMLLRRNARQDGDRYLVRTKAKRGQRSSEVDIGEDMPLYESLDGIKRTVNQLIWHKVTGIPDGIPVDMKGQMGSEVETQGGSKYMGTMYLRKTRLAAKMFDLAFSPEASRMTPEERHRLVEASKLLCRGTDPLTLIRNDPEFANVRQVNWRDISPDIKQRAIDKASHMAGDDDISTQRGRRDDPANWPALKFLGDKIHQFISDGTLELGREDFVDGNSIPQVFEKYKQHRPVVNGYGMPMVVDEENTERDENGDIVGDMSTRPYSMEDFRAGRKGSIENLDISAHHEFEPMVHQGVTYGRQHDPETGREVFKAIPGLTRKVVRGIPVVYPATQMEFRYSFGRQERRSVKGVMWKVMDDEAVNVPQPGEVIEAIIQTPEVFTKALNPKQNLAKVLKELKGWELIRLDQYLKKTYRPNGVKYSTKNKAPTPFTTRDFSAASHRASERSLMVPQWEEFNGMRQRRVDAQGNPIMVEASGAGLDIDRVDDNNYFRLFLQALDVMRAFFGSFPGATDAWGDMALGPQPDMSLHDLQVALHTSHDAMSLYLRYKEQGTLNMEARTWTDRAGQVHRFTEEEARLLERAERVLSSVMEVGPIEEGDEGDEEEGEEAEAKTIRMPTSYYEDAARLYEATRQAAQNPDRQDEIMSEVLGYERGTMYAVRRRTGVGDEPVKLGREYQVVFPYEMVAREWIRTHHPNDDSYFVAPVPSEGPLPMAPSHIENLGEEGTLARATDNPEVINATSIVEAMREIIDRPEDVVPGEPEEDVIPGAPEEPEAPPAPEDVVPEEAVPEDVVPGEAAPEDVVPEEVVPQEFAAEPAATTPLTTPVTTPVPPAKKPGVPTRQDREASAIKKLVALADKLDEVGRHEEANAVDGVIQYSLKRFKEEK